MSLPSETESSLSGSAAQKAEQYGLRRMGVRPPLGEYIKSVWSRRKFVAVLARSKIYAENQNMYLGQLWSVVNPAMNALVYVLIFGVILNVSRGLNDAVAFIVVGTFIYKFFSDSVTGAAKSIPGNLKLVRSLHFPRAVLPLSMVGAQLVSLVPAIGVMAAWVLVSGRFMADTIVDPSLSWFLIVPAIALLYIFGMGVGFVLARVGAIVPDTLNLLPFLLRIGMYASGVLFPVTRYIAKFNSPLLETILDYQPVAIYLDLARQAMLQEPTIPLDITKWIWGLGWALAFFIVGFIIFWRDEARYGRE